VYDSAPAQRWRLHRLCWLPALAGALAGCAERGQLLSGGSSAQMKSSLSHVQFENEQLKTEVAKLKEENRSIEDRLVQEQLHTGDLAARLDNARNLLRDRGLDSDTRLGARSRSEGADTDDELARPRALPAGRGTRKPRKPPAAAIPGDLDARLPPAPDGDGDDGGTISFKAPDAAPPGPRLADLSRQRPPDAASDLIWQPVATAGDPQAPPTRR
jgi:hypothetical protein